jgi:manganese transport protein
MATEPVTQIAVGEPPLQGLHASVSISHSPIYCRRLLEFLGPGFLISVGYIDPGNWTTDINGGSGMGAPDIEAGPEKLTHEKQAGT